MDLERRARLRQRLQRHVRARRSFASWSTAWRWLNVPRSTSSPVRRIGDAVGEDRRERQLLGGGPVDRPLVGVVERMRRRSSRPRSSLRWTVKPGGHAQQRRRSARAAARAAPPCCACAAAPGGGDLRQSARRGRCSGSSVVERLLAARPCAAATIASARVRRRSRRATRASRAQMLAHRRMRRDLLVHQRLRERRLVALVVAVAPVADQVDQEVALERLRGTRTPAAPPRCTPPDRRR